VFGTERITLWHNTAILGLGAMDDRKKPCHKANKNNSQKFQEKVIYRVYAFVILGAGSLAGGGCDPIDIMLVTRGYRVIATNNGDRSFRGTTSNVSRRTYTQ
jgi:hypothetical protein